MRRLTLREFDRMVSKLRTAVKQRRVVRVVESQEHGTDRPYFVSTVVCGERQGYTKTTSFTVLAKP